MPLTADRWLTVSHTSDPRRRHVSVFGFRYSDSSGHVEAENAPAMSLINPITNTPETLIPADVSPTTVVEVWVERLDVSKGEDFGWERVSVAQGGPDILTHGPLIQAAAVDEVRPQDLVRAKKFVATRRYADAVATGVLDSVFGFLRIWDGDVLLPSAPGPGTRYRLVIAEYEEYIVDDTRPYDPVPTKKGRRLVFVEHVELTALA